MLHDIQAIKRDFSRLNTHAAIIELLLPLLDPETSISADDKGWAFWNVCDRYAMLRNAKDQHRYQSEFFEWSKSALPSLRFHWVVSDGTQAMTLIAGDFLDFWWNCYQFANESVPRVAENRTVRFESHRANAAAYTHFQEFSRAETALQSIEAVLSEDSTWLNRNFATVTYTTLLITFYAGLGQSEQIGRRVEDLELYLGEWQRHFQKSAVRTEYPLLGSWEQLNADRPPEAIYTAIHNAACALVIAKQFVKAERLFRIVLDEQREGMTEYSKALYLLACWNNRRNKDEIRDLLHGFQNLTLPQVSKFAPELTDVLGE